MFQNKAKARVSQPGRVLPKLNQLAARVEKNKTLVAAAAAGGIVGLRVLSALLARRKDNAGSHRAAGLKKGSGRATAADTPEQLELIASGRASPPQAIITPDEWRQQAAAQLRQELRAVQQYAAQLEDKLNAARHERKKVNTEVARAREAVRATEQQLATALEHIAALQSRTTALLAERKSAERGLMELNGQLSSTKNAAASKMRSMQQQVETLQAALKDASAARATAETQLFGLRKQAAAQQHRQQQGAASMQRVLAEVEAARKEADEMRRACHALHEELEASRSACATRQAQLATVQHELRRLQADGKQARINSPAAR